MLQCCASLRLGCVLEVEAGRAFDNNQFLKDIFQACMMDDVVHLAISVRNSYRGSDDFERLRIFSRLSTLADDSNFL